MKAEMIHMFYTIMTAEMIRISTSFMRPPCTDDKSSMCKGTNDLHVLCLRAQMIHISMHESRNDTISGLQMIHIFYAGGHK